MAEQTQTAGKKRTNFKPARFISKKLLLKLFPGLAHKLRQRQWERKWSRDNYDPVWMASGIPQDIQDAVTREWFAPGSTLLDIGCGDGDISAWLAAQNLNVTGVDYAAAAIEKAKVDHPESAGKLAFDVVDILKPKTGLAQYDALLDRGCFHNIPHAFAADYARNVAAAIKPGGHFLLFYTTFNKLNNQEEAQEKSRQQTIRYIEDALQDEFEFVEMTQTYINKDPDRLSKFTGMGMAFWLKRRSQD